MAALKGRQRPALLGVAGGAFLGVIGFLIVTTFPGGAGTLASRLSLGEEDSNRTAVEAGFRETANNARVRISLSELRSGKPFDHLRRSIEGRDRQLARVLVMVKNRGSAPITVSPAFFYLVDDRESTLSAANHLDVFPGQLATVRVQPGDNAAGWVLFETLSAKEPARLVYDDGHGAPIRFSLSRSVE